MPQSAAICRHLGFAEDRTVVRTVPDAAHRCYAQTPPGSPDNWQQGRFCLAAGQEACPFYVVPEPSATLASGKAPLQPMPLLSKLLRRRAKLLWPWGLVAVLLAVLAVYTYDTLWLSGASTTPLSTETATRVAPTATPPPSSAVPRSTPRPPAAMARYSTPTAEPGGRVLELAPGSGSVGWWTGSEARGNHLGDSYLYAGFFDGQPFASAIIFDLTSVPRGAPIHDAALRLTGLQADRFDPAAGGAWSVQLLSPNALQDVANNPARADFQKIFNAPADVTLFPTLYPADLGRGLVNVLALDASSRAWLARQISDGVPYVIARIVGPTGGSQSLFAWDSGAGPATGGDTPKLMLSLGAAPPTPPPLPTELVLVATLTPTPADVMTAAAQVQTATAFATLYGTPALAPYRLVTPTPIPENLATAQALAFALGLPPIVVSTPTPANAVTATYQARYATAVAIATGTFTPIPTDAVTPVVVLPTPIPQNIVTAAAQIQTATAGAARGDVTTPLPFNAVFATLTPEPIVLVKTPAPENAATARSLSAYATAVAIVFGTFTPLPPNAVWATVTPAPTLVPLVLYLNQLPATAQPTPTPTVPSSIPGALVGKILFTSDRDGEPTLLALDPASGRLAYVTQSWPSALAAIPETRSQDGRFALWVRETGGSNGSLRPHIFLDDGLYGTTRQLTSGNSMNYDAIWSPQGDRIAFVSTEPGNDEIFTIAPDGSDRRRLTANTWEWDKHPTWSPDGSQIVFFSNRDTGRRQLWIMNADGSNQRPLLQSAFNDWDPIWIK